MKREVPPGPATFWTGQLWHSKSPVLNWGVVTVENLVVAAAAFVNERMRRSLGISVAVVFVVPFEELFNDVRVFNLLALSGGREEVEGFSCG